MKDRREFVLFFLVCFCPVFILFFSFSLIFFSLYLVGRADLPDCFLENDEFSSLNSEKVTIMTEGIFRKRKEERNT